MLVSESAVSSHIGIELLYTVSSLALQLWDVVITLQSEIEHIWPKPWNSFFKWLYLSLRYLSLATQIFHQFAVPYLNSGKALKSSCFAWYVYSTLMAQFQTTAVEIILAVRVYALFNRSRHIAILLGSLMTLEYIILTIVISGYFDKIPSIPHCILSKPPYQLIYPAIVAVVLQSTLLGLALTKHILARRAGWGRAPLVSLLIRDGMATYFIICGMNFASDIAILLMISDALNVIAVSWLISITSSCGCRLIVNMQRLAVAEKFVPHSPITSEIEIEFSYQSM
ncbi:hypothetical protein DFJ58DRAFT_667820 [Suillus subalutaceus]|uniref:uncharacterized protein n=1 Tax=Suillus subalutaceus TaxID=48586 RepID=UPI001B87B38A|nr:uncharacterized protein DFJ58DRAFT_667820 [Suillus subalutaceus]KAG1839328.1 hypothetical protein DFJ58DRAFT_667820 [Suillus subalutaceus]